MKTFWDLTERERAALEPAQVEKYLAIELMEEGVLTVEPPVLEELKPVPMSTRKVYSLVEVDGSVQHFLGLSFPSEAEASVIAAGLRYVRENDYSGPSCTRPVKRVTVITEDLPTEEAKAEVAITWQERQRREMANARALREYEQAQEKVSKATGKVWSAWREAQEIEGHRAHIRRVFDEYLKMTEGDYQLARAFLAKVPDFSLDDIREALGEPAETPAVEKLPTDPVAAVTQTMDAARAEKVGTAAGESRGSAMEDAPW